MAPFKGLVPPQAGFYWWVLIKKILLNMPKNRLRENSLS